MHLPALLILNCCLAAALPTDGPSVGPSADRPASKAVGDFQLHGSQARVHRLSDWREQEILAIAVLGVECPLANLYAGTLNELAARYHDRGVQFIGIDSNWHDTLSEIDEFSRRHQLGFPLYKDPDGSAARALGATRTPEVFVLDRQRRVRYRGRIDDRYTVNSRREQATQSNLAAAIDDLLAGREVALPQTLATGCLIAWPTHSADRPASEDQKAVTFSHDIAPLLSRRCVGCHRPGQAAPFSLISYDDALAWAATIAEVVEQGRMPPWYADPRHGQFANDTHLSDDEKRLIAAWVDTGCQQGEQGKLNIDLPPVPDRGWAVGSPDRIISLPKPFAVPAQGVIDYHIVAVDPQFSHDVWVCAAEIQPGNRAVVHHASVFLQPPGQAAAFEAGSLGSICLAAMAPGSGPTVLPPGMAKRVPAGWKLLFVVHYTPTGTATSDQTRLGLKFIDAADVRHEVATRLLVDEQLTIAPYAADHLVQHECTLGEDVLLLSMFPHMHARGKSFCYEAIYPDGRNETLLSVPRWNFDWQNRYELAEPKPLPAGTVIRCTAHYDNSAANPANPDPSATVHIGPQAWDEMFNGYFDVARVAPAEGLAATESRSSQWPWRRVLLPAMVMALWMLLRRPRSENISVARCGGS